MAYAVPAVSSPTLLLDDLLRRVCELLQISPTNYKEAADRYSAIDQVLAGVNSPLARFQPKIYPQGSMRIQTTVKPIGREEHDLDIVCQFALDPRPISDSVALLHAIQQTLANAGYRGMLEVKNRCVRVRYANKFHLDILPACPDPDVAGCLLVPDRKAAASNTHSWKASNPEGFAKWFLDTQYQELVKFAESRKQPLPKLEAVEEKSTLKLAVQLLKRGRDISFSAAGREATPSVVLTTLSAQLFQGQPSISGALTAILDGVQSRLRESPRMTVLNPVNFKEDFSERWNDRLKYSEFARNINQFANAWKNAQSFNDMKEMTAAIERLFGEDVTRRALTEQAKSMRELHEKGGLAVQRKTGSIVSAAAASSVAIPRNNFYGKR